VVTAWPNVAELRGKGMAEGGQFFGDPRDGRFVPRKVAGDMRTTPPSHAQSQGKELVAP